jgi:hypothetical protein
MVANIQRSIQSKQDHSQSSKYSFMRPAPTAIVQRSRMPQMIASMPPQVNSLYSSQQIVKAESASRAYTINMLVNSTALQTAGQRNMIQKPWGMPRLTKVEMAGATLDGDSFVPDMQRRSIMNLVLLGGAAVPVGWMGGGFIYFFVPPSKGGGEGGVKALDA